MFPAYERDYLHWYNGKIIASVTHYYVLSTAGEPFAQVEEFTVCDPDLTAYAVLICTE